MRASNSLEWPHRRGRLQTCRKLRQSRPQQCGRGASRPSSDLRPRRDRRRHRGDRPRFGQGRQKPGPQHVRVHPNRPGPSDRRSGVWSPSRVGARHSLARRCVDHVRGADRRGGHCFSCVGGSDTRARVFPSDRRTRDTDGGHERSLSVCPPSFVYGCTRSSLGSG